VLLERCVQLTATPLPPPYTVAVNSDVYRCLEHRRLLAIVPNATSPASPRPFSRSLGAVGPAARRFWVVRVRAPFTPRHTLRGGGGLEPRTTGQTFPRPLPPIPPRHHSAPPAGFEPATHGLGNRRSIL
jgi:hypothetical protein